MFLKYLHDLEAERRDRAELDGDTYTPIINGQYRWDAWAAPMKITRVLTDNGKEFTDRLFGLRKCAATGKHEFDLLCAKLGIERRLAPPPMRSPSRRSRTR